MIDELFNISYIPYILLILTYYIGRKIKH